MKIMQETSLLFGIILPSSGGRVREARAGCRTKLALPTTFMIYIYKTLMFFRLFLCCARFFALSLKIQTSFFR